MKAIPKHITTILFDLDGVIVDSMPYHFIAWYEALKAFGVTVNSFDIYDREGERWDRTLPYFLNRQNIKYDEKLLQKIFKLRTKLFRKYFKCSLFSHAEEIILALKAKGYRLGIVSGTPVPEIKRILPKKIFKVFDCVIGGNMVANGKPHPEPYHKASLALNSKPANCLVIENAPLGVTSAKKAGMYCLAVTTSLPKEYLHEADYVIPTLWDLRKIISA